MAKLRIFVSSTCYDLSIVRDELRPFLVNMGYEPIMSEYSDVLYDPRSHTHESCIKEIPGCDMVILIIGGRFGGTAIPNVTKDISTDFLRTQAHKTSILDSEKLSITQLEVLKAVEQGVPVYAFVEDRVYHDHHVYEKNKNTRDIIDSIQFPSIQKQDTAKYIFEFINFITSRTRNNSLISFARLGEIKEHLTAQWSQLFQRLLGESKTRTVDTIRYQQFTESLSLIHI